MMNIGSTDAAPEYIIGLMGTAGEHGDDDLGDETMSASTMTRLLPTYVIVMGRVLRVPMMTSLMIPMTVTRPVRIWTTRTLIGGSTSSCPQE
jgi:hypothetical protein